MTTRLDVCGLADLPEGSRTAVCHNGRQIAVFNVDGSVFAVRDRCPHQGAPLSFGLVGGTMRASRPHEYDFDGAAQVVNCPWHHWEFDLADGSCLTDARIRIKRYDVEIECGRIYVLV